MALGAAAAVDMFQKNIDELFSSIPNVLLLMVRLYWMFQWAGQQPQSNIR